MGAFPLPDVSGASETSMFFETGKWVWFTRNARNSTACYWVWDVLRKVTKYLISVHLGAREMQGCKIWPIDLQRELHPAESECDQRIIFQSSCDLWNISKIQMHKIWFQYRVNSHWSTERIASRAECEFNHRIVLEAWCEIRNTSEIVIWVKHWVQLYTIKSRNILNLENSNVWNLISL